jgi:hypothetical protein
MRFPDASGTGKSQNPPPRRQSRRPGIPHGAEGVYVSAAGDGSLIHVKRRTAELLMADCTTRDH